MRSWFSPAWTRIPFIIKKIHRQAWQLHFNGGQQDSGTLPTHRMKVKNKVKKSQC